MGQNLMPDPAAMRKCKICGEEKLVLIDFPNYSSTPVCKKCKSQKEKLRRHKLYGMRPENHWKYKRFGPGPNLKEMCGQENQKAKRKNG
jgi:hypothetical protein